MLMTLGVAFLTIFKTIEPAGDAPQAETAGPFSHELLDQVQQRYVNDEGRVDYRGLRADPEKLDTYYQLVATYSPDSHPELFPSEHDRLAYWINAYNAATLTAVLSEYPITSVSDVKAPRILFFAPDKSGFFYFRKLLFGGESYNLYNLEKEVIRGRFPEPRIHFAINCASNGCPRLPQRAFTSDQLEQQLETEARRFTNEPRNLRFDHEQQVLHVSSIFAWYEEDYVAWYREKYPEGDASLVNYLRLYLAEDRVAELDRAVDYEVRAMEYDWGLNDQALEATGQ
jgi:hypothetical protein